MTFCPSATSECSDNTCIAYQIHHTCNRHSLHIGDRIKNTHRDNKLGYIHNLNPLRSNRSAVILYDDGEIESIFGYNVCAYIKLTGEPRDLTKIDKQYKSE